MTNTHPKLEKVRALLNTAESLSQQGNTEAAESYRERAIAMMTSHGIDEMMLAATEKRREEIVKVRIDIPDPYSKDKGILLHQVAKGLGCKSIRITGVKDKHCYVIGFEGDVERVEMLYTSLLLQAFGELAKIRPEDVIPHYSTPFYYSKAEKGRARTTYNKAWLSGFAQTVGTRLWEATQRARQQYETDHSTSTALVVASRESQVEAFYEGAFTNVRRGGRRQLNSWQGYGHGEKAGQRANIGTTTVGGKRAALTR